ncbi:MAG: GNAT family protein [Peptococcaceae bacterium]|nr:GNAT family protein [Peptococcaceae bacterium]
MDDTAIEVRLGKPADAKGILDCLLLTLSEHTWFDRDENESGITNPDVLGIKISQFKLGEKAYIVAVDQDKVVGFILLVRGGLHSVRHTCDLGMSLLPEYREKGIGSRLLQAAIDWTRQHGMDKIYCSTFNTNHRAVRLYEKFGFEREGVRRKQYKIAGEYVDQILFGKLLNA